MKQASVIALLCMLALGANALFVRNDMKKDKTITQVVKLLQEMLDKSKAEGDSERKAYALYICDCDKRSTEYKATIASSEEKITLLANQIAGLKAANAKLSEECAELKAAMAENEAAQKSAEALRKKQNTAFLAEKEDLEGAIKQLTDAIQTLAAVSADQTAGDATGMDHTKFMSGYTPKYSPVSLMKAKSSLKQALVAASIFMDDKKAQTVASFMQAPFTGTYTSQSVEVMGILKDMKTTFTSNLNAAIKQEAKELAAHEKFMALKKAEYETMSKSYDKKQGELADNDGSLAAKKDEKKVTEATMKEAQEFLAETEKLCASKKEEYSKRRMLQVGEEAAIAEAIAILNSDEAFATFGTVSATSTGKLAFVQLRSIQKHTVEREALRSQLIKMLQKGKGSKRISKLVSIVQATNVFATVLEEIDKMLALIDEEAKTDKTNLDFCNSERTKNDKLIAEKTAAISSLEKEITDLDNLMNDPETGLKKQISDTEESLAQNAADQKKKTKERKEAHLLYQEDIKNLDDAEEILTKAISVLSAYYKKLDDALAGASLVQKHGSSKRNTPVPTEDTAVIKMEGESKSGKEVITKLQFILSETEEEEKDANSEELKSQQDFDNEMEQLKGQESNLQQGLASLQGNLAQAEKDMLVKQKDLKMTEEEKAAAEAYLAEIKPGCDFITHNFDLREKNRLEEKTTLEKAIELVKGTPEYKSYEAAAHQESLGDCQESCKDEENVKCKACLADVTIPAYCAGHEGVPGC